MAMFKSEYSALGIGEDDSFEEFRFDLNEVVAYNRSSDPEYATIWFMDTSITITMSIEELDKLLLLNE